MYACRLFAIFVLLIFAFIPCLLIIVVYQNGQSRISEERQGEIPEAALTGSDISYMTGSDVTEVIACACATGSRVFFLTIVVMQNVQLRMTDTATGGDQRSRDPEGSPLEACAHTQPKIAQYPL